MAKNSSPFDSPMEGCYPPPKVGEHLVPMDKSPSGRIDTHNQHKFPGQKGTPDQSPIKPAFKTKK